MDTIMDVDTNNIVHLNPYDATMDPSIYLDEDIDSSDFMDISDSDGDFDICDSDEDWDLDISHTNMDLNVSVPDVNMNTFDSGVDQDTSIHLGTSDTPVHQYTSYNSKYIKYSIFCKKYLPIVKNRKCPTCSQTQLHTTNRCSALSSELLIH
ncbi:uncharacterized protein LOC116852591 [Odontomachus brunneus]|uniref:uncharacterized protein LOC116852591 n=1 Tax=Odontomachus brunneus TaxID=486640 RepID=UPI0013F229A8|nr:uncharacterized protein LOC116852591 [Odontomachus brunneus]